MYGDWVSELLAGVGDVAKSAATVGITALGSAATADAQSKIYQAQADVEAQKAMIAAQQTALATQTTKQEQTKTIMTVGVVAVIAAVIGFGMYTYARR